MLWYGIGILYDRYGSYDYAEEAFSQVMAIQPDFEKANEIYFRLGIIYKQQSKFAQSLEVRQRSHHSSPQRLLSLTSSPVLQIHCEFSAWAPYPGRHLVPDRPRARTAERCKFPLAHLSPRGCVIC